MSTALRSRAEARLQALRRDLTNGRAQLAQLQEVLPQIAGAVQILEELLALPDQVPLPRDGALQEEVLCLNPNEVELTSSP